jgi:beta-galactosidase
VLGYYQGKVAEQWENYAEPQANGNKADVRWAAVTDAAGTGLKFFGDQAIQVNVKNYATKNVHEARLTTELEQLEETIVSVSHFEGPLGNASVGRVTPLEKYRLVPQELTFTIMLEPVTMQSVASTGN